MVLGKIGRVCVEVVEAYGDPNVRALHRTTFEITKDDYLTPRGDCIIGIRSSKALADLSDEFRDIMRHENSILIAILKCQDIVDVVICRGSPNLTLSSDRKIIFRKSAYTSPDTIGIMCSKAARDLRRDLIEKLMNRSSKLDVILVALEVR